MSHWTRLARVRFPEFRYLMETSAAQNLRDTSVSMQQGAPFPSADELAAFYKSYRAQRASHLPGIDWELADRVLSKMAPVTPDEDTAVWGVILETRAHPNLEYTVCDACERLAIPVQVIHGISNREFILGTRIAELVEAGQVVLTEIDDTEFSVDAYNGMFMAPDFWQRLKGRKKILVFQTDSILCPGSDFTLSDFMGFDYIGSAWKYEANPEINFRGGNGGFSLRDWRSSVECLTQFPPADWPSSEDKYFAFHMELLGAKVANSHDSLRFSSEKWFFYKSFGAHQVSRMSPVVLGLFIDYCPEATRIADDKEVDRNLLRRIRARMKSFVLRRALDKSVQAGL